MKTSQSTDCYVVDHLPPRDQWPEFINRDLVSTKFLANSAAEFIDKAVQEGYGDKVAIISPNGNWTYKRLLEKSNQIAHVLTENMGLIPGQRVLLRSPNNPMLAACWLAVLKTGGIIVNTMPMLRAKELISIGEIAKVSLALCDERFKEELEGLAPELQFYCTFNGAETGTEIQQPPLSLEALMADKPGVFDNHLCATTDVALLAFTSGTTGQPKAAVHTHNALLAVCETFSKQVLKPATDDIFACTTPMAFVYGLGGILLFPLYARASTLMLEDVSPASLVSAIERFKVTILFTAPTAYKVLLENYDAKKLGCLRRCVSAGESLPGYITQAWLDKSGVRILDGIGSTEMLHIFLAVQEPETPIGALGKAVPGYEIRVRGEDGNDVPAGESGLLYVRGPTGCVYLNDERQSKYVVDGWNCTNDTVRMDEKGFVWYQSRSDGMIVSSGYNISASEVESVVSQHPAVAECAVIGIPDEARGQLVKSYVVLCEGQTESSDLIENIQKFAKTNAAPNKYPRQNEFIQALQRTLTGKVQHYRLREMHNNSTSA